MSSTTTAKRKPGRPRLDIDPQAVAELRRAPERWTWEQIAGKLGVSSDTAMKAWRREMDIKPIETLYLGYRFRSRLEARWACFFDNAGVAFEYEKEGYVIEGTPYLPDFWLPGYGVFIEVKGDIPTAAEDDLMRGLRDATGHAAMIFHGIPGQYMGHLYAWGDEREDDYGVRVSGSDGSSNELAFHLGKDYNETDIYSSNGVLLHKTRRGWVATGSRIWNAVHAAKQARFGKR